MSETVARAYRYALLLTPAQEAAVQRQERQLRHAWNKMVNWQRCALRDWKYGRQTHMLAEMRQLLDGKLLTGQAAAKANKRAMESGVSREKAVALNRQEAVTKKAKYGSRRLGVELAQEKVYANAKFFFGGQKCLLHALVQKFSKSCENWLKLRGTAQAPRYKRSQDGVSLQRQVLKTSKCDFGPETPEGIAEIDLSLMLGQAGTRCRVRWHRHLPDGSVVKQTAISGRPNRRYFVVFLDCPRKSILKPFAKSDSRAGIDTGYSCALTVVSNAYIKNRKLRREALAVDVRLDQKLSDDPQSGDAKALTGALTNLERYIFSNNLALELQPTLARDGNFLKKLRRLQRKMDRQKRAANPECFNADGTWKKGKRANILTNSLLKTHIEIQRMNERVADVRRDFYHVAAFNLLKDHGHVVIGDWRPPALHKGDKPVEKGQAVRRRNMNRKGLDHAISSFESIMVDKAELSANPRKVEIVHEPYTTQTCACCKALTGPQGPTNIVSWICSGCGAENHRKSNAAENIREISATIVAVTAGAQPVAATT